VLKPQVALNELHLDSIDITCPSIINKYLNHPNAINRDHYHNFFFITLQRLKFPNVIISKLSSL
jgi:hypothetical protein